jgi:hypothetical protein
MEVYVQMSIEKLVIIHEQILYALLQVLTTLLCNQHATE